MSYGNKAVLVNHKIKIRQWQNLTSTKQTGTAGLRKPAVLSRVVGFSAWAVLCLGSELSGDQWATGSGRCHVIFPVQENQAVPLQAEIKANSCSLGWVRKFSQVSAGSTATGFCPGACVKADQRLLHPGDCSNIGSQDLRIWFTSILQ